MTQKKANNDQLPLNSDGKEDQLKDVKAEVDIGADTNNSFEKFSPLLNDEVIERENEIILEAQVPPPESQLQTPERPEEVLPSFGMPQFNISEKFIPLPGLQTDKVDKPDEKDVSSNDQFQKTEIQSEPSAGKELPRMNIESDEIPEEEPDLRNIKKKAGQTTAKWSWTLFENATPKIQQFFSELDESEIRRLVIDDKLPEEAIDFAKDYNKSLLDEFEIKDWEKELIYPPFEELLQQAGMDTSMSPGARLGVGLTVVLSARAIQTRKYRREREELVNRLIHSYSRSKAGTNPSSESDNKQVE